MNAPQGRGERLLALFEELVDLDAGARAARLAALREADVALADELARMLEADDGSGVLDRGMAAMAATVAGDLAPGSRPADGAQGRRVGPFVLGHLLGRGGMGEVWLATRSEGDFQQQVALKLLKRGMDSEDLLRRFVQERRILAGLSHPGIARFIDGGVGDDGAPWYAMEYVEGVPLTEHARALGLDVRARIDLVASVAEAVAYAQNRLVVHRDLKPSNILVDAQGRVRLLDFGIAKLLDEAPGVEATATGVRAMSPAYAAPEQILDEPISAATDVYSLGVVLYELLTGGLPHERASATLDTLAERVRREAPERPSQRLRKADAATTTTLGGDGSTAQRFARVVAGELDTIVLTALRREPERRYASAAALADDLRRWLDGRPVAAQADTVTYRMRKFVARHRLAVGSASAVLLALIAGFGTALWQADVAREQARRAQAEATKATAIKDFLLASFNTAQIGTPTDARGAATTVIEIIERSGSALLTDDLLEPEVRLELLTALGELHRINGLTAQAEPLQLKALEIAREYYGPTSEKYVYALVERGTNLPQIGRREESNAVLDDAIAIMEATGQHGTESYPFALWRRGVNAYGAGRLDEALGLFERAEAACREWRPTDPTHGLALQWQANVHQQRDGFDAAEAALQRAIVLARAGERAEQAEGLARTYLGDVFSRKGDFDAALVEYDQAARLLEQTDAGGRDGDRAVLLANRARAKAELGQREAARADVGAALGIAKHHPGAEPGRGLDDRARTALLVGHLVDGDAAAAQALARELAARWPPDATGGTFANNQMLLAEAELLAGDARRARPAAERALAIHDAAGPDTLLARQAHLVLAEVLERLGDGAARQHYERVLQPALADAARPPAASRSVQRARALAGLARLALRADPASAQRYAREGLTELPQPRFLRERRLHAQLQALASDAAPGP
jgi:serine/threonine-protein kinase